MFWWKDSQRRVCNKIYPVDMTVTHSLEVMAATTIVEAGKDFLTLVCHLTMTRARPDQDNCIHTAADELSTVCRLSSYSWLYAPRQREDSCWNAIYVCMLVDGLMAEEILFRMQLHIEQQQT